MLDRHQRAINYLRVSITDRCNFRCNYCMPSEGVELLDHHDILTYEEILRVIRVLGRNGVDKIRITGGEPLVRKGVVEFVRCIKEMQITSDLSLTTNGSLLGNYAHSLKQAGLNRVNISLDTLDKNKFSQISGGGSLANVMDGINAAIEAGLDPVKINVVVTEQLSLNDVASFLEMMRLCPVSVRFIEYMPMGNCYLEQGLTVEEIMTAIQTAIGERLESAHQSRGNGPARYYKLPGARGLVGFITPITDHFCGKCNRVRLTADGKIKPCLLSDIEFDIKRLIRGGADDKVLAELFSRAVETKPGRHALKTSNNTTDFGWKMSQIGG